jgi:hypothetical protein
MDPAHKPEPGVPLKNLRCYNVRIGVIDNEFFGGKEILENIG